MIVASGPLTSDPLAEAIRAFFPESRTLNFYDAAAPLVTFESVDMDSAFFASRYDRGTPDYINCPMTEEEYDAFWTELCAAQEAEVHGFEDKHVFEGCMPVEVMARRGKQTLCYGPLKPRGLNDPKTGKEPFAVVQLRRDNADGTIYNLVGFQTHLKWPEQRRVFSMIPALRNAEFVRYGVMHRNSYINSPLCLRPTYQTVKREDLFFAGQMTGVEGYIESAASGLNAGIQCARLVLGLTPEPFPQTCMIGAMAHYITHADPKHFQPMNANFGILPLVQKVKKSERKEAYGIQALNELAQFQQSLSWNTK